MKNDYDVEVKSHRDVTVSRTIGRHRHIAGYHDNVLEKKRFPIVHRRYTQKCASIAHVER